VRAHSTKSVSYDWRARTRMIFAFSDDSNGKTLGSKLVVKT
jgi:hypothetical protein